MRARGNRSTSSRSDVPVRVDSVVRALEAVDVPEAGFEESADEVGEATIAY